MSRLDAEAVAEALGGAKKSGDGWLARCPAHDDRDPSLKLDDGENERVLWHCFGGCDQETVRARLREMGLIESSNVAAPSPPSTTRKPSAPSTTSPPDQQVRMPVPDDAGESRFPENWRGRPFRCSWTYRDAEGRVLLHVARFDNADGKDIVPFTFTDGHGWQAKGPPKATPLYGLDRLAARPDGPVLVVEGEKAADAATSLFPDRVALTWLGGANRVRHADWSPLRGRRVVLWPDADEPGTKAMKEAAAKIRDAGAASVAMVTLPDGLPEGWDVADPVPDGIDLHELPRAAQPVEVASGEVEADDETELRRLAALPPIEYEREREAAAKRLECRVGILDKLVEDHRRKLQPPVNASPAQGSPLELEPPEPWPDPVDGDALLRELVAALTRYVVLADGAAVAMALWVLHAHAFGAASVSPILALLSPEKRCGKTTALGVLSALCPKVLATGNITPAAVFRVVERYQPTLLIDEADTFLDARDELRGILNAGHTPATAYVIRTVGDDHEPRRFSVWTPKVLARIGKLADTLADRSIVIPMRRKRADERVERFRANRCRDLAGLSRRCARWAADRLDALRDLEPKAPKGLHDRAADNWHPLLAIADAIGAEWPNRAREVALKLADVAGAEDDSAGGTLLADLRDLFAERGTDRLRTTAILEAFAAREERPWPEWKQGKPITARQLAGLLKPFGVAPRTLRFGVRPEKGYALDDFRDVFERYLSPTDRLHGNNVEIPRTYDGIDRLQGGAVLPIESAEILNDFAHVTDVTDPAGEIDEEMAEWSA